jgi:hypothetical protein
MFPIAEVDELRDKVRKLEKRVNEIERTLRERLLLPPKEERPARRSKWGGLNDELFGEDDDKR